MKCAFRFPDARADEADLERGTDENQIFQQCAWSAFGSVCGCRVIECGHREQCSAGREACAADKRSRRAHVATSRKRSGNAHAAAQSACRAYAASGSACDAYLQSSPDAAASGTRSQQQCPSRAV